MLEPAAAAIGWLAEEFVHEGVTRVLMMDSLLARLEAGQPVGGELSVARRELDKLRALFTSARRMPFPAVETAERPLLELVSAAVGALGAVARTATVSVPSDLMVRVGPRFEEDVLAPAMWWLRASAPEEALDVVATRAAREISLDLTGGAPPALGAKPWEARHPDHLMLLLARRIARAHGVAMGQVTGGAGAGLRLTFDEGGVA